MDFLLCLGLLMAKRYLIPALEPLAIHRTQCHIKRSLFICSMGHAEHMDMAKSFVEQIKKEFPDATHNCWAFAAGPPADTAQVGFSDDGEPHGTAGRPMLTTLLHSELGELVCVVTRYFGGVKLGTGGLVRAYQGAVLENLITLPRCERVNKINMQISISYAHIDRLHRLLPSFEATVQNEDFNTQADFLLNLPEEHYHSFKQALANATDGTAKIL